MSFRLPFCSERKTAINLQLLRRSKPLAGSSQTTNFCSASNVSPNFPELEQKAEEVRGRVALHPQDPVPEIVGVLEQLGLRVIVRPLGKDGPQGIYARRADFAAVLLNGSDYLPRFRFSGAHELGHHVLDHFEAHIDVDFSETTGKEKEANAFAASFLMPRRALWDRVANLGKKLTAD